MSESAELDRAFSLHVDENIVVVRWMPGVEITGPLAAAAMATVDKLNGDHKRPLLVDMTGTANVTRDARGAFSRECQVSRMALVGRSAVDRDDRQLRAEGQQDRHPVAVLHLAARRAGVAA